MKGKYVYLVYCNQEPIVYGVESSRKKAMEYAQYLIDHRKPPGHYHWMLLTPKQIRDCDTRG